MMRAAQGVIARARVMVAPNVGCKSEQEISAKVQVQKHVARRCMKAYTEDGRYDGATLRQGVSTRARPRYM